MKKIFMTACAATMLFSVVSCGQSGLSGSTEVKTPEDSLSYYFGKMWGSGLKSEIKTSSDSAKFDADEFIRGIKAPMEADTNTVGYIQGLSTGGQLMQQFNQIEAESGIKINRALFISELSKELKSSEVTSPQELQFKAMHLLQQISEKKKAESPEAIANANAGKVAIEKAMAADSELIKDKSGIVYKMINAGKGEPFKATDMVNVIYVGKHIDGTVFDDSKGEAIQFSPNQVVLGFKEALLMMKPGAKMIVYIPGELGYGVAGNQGIGSMETLVFEIETPSLAK